MNDNLLVKVLDVKKEIQTYDKIKYVRILSKKYNLLIMRDYLPIIGEIEGSIEIEGENSIKIENIKGYYMNKNNVFNLIIKEVLWVLFCTMY